MSLKTQTSTTGRNARKSASSSQLPTTWTQISETKVRFYVNPLAVLPKLPQTSVTLGGFRSTTTIEVTFVSPDTNDGGPPAAELPGDPLTGLPKA